jgi:hypothetical protein
VVGSRWNVPAIAAIHVVAPEFRLRILFPVVEVTTLRLQGLPPTVADSAPFRGGHELVFLLGSLAVIATLGPSWRLATGLFLTLYAIRYVAAPIFQIYYPSDTPGVFFCLLVIRLCMRPRMVVAGAYARLGPPPPVAA